MSWARDLIESIASGLRVVCRSCGHADEVVVCLPDVPSIPDVPYYYGTTCDRCWSSEVEVARLDGSPRIVVHRGGRRVLMLSLEEVGALGLEARREDDGVLVPFDSILERLTEGTQWLVEAGEEMRQVVVTQGVPRGTRLVCGRYRGDVEKIFALLEHDDWEEALLGDDISERRPDLVRPRFVVLPLPAVATA